MSFMLFFQLSFSFAFRALIDLSKPAVSGAGVSVMLACSQGNHALAFQKLSEMYNDFKCL